MLKESHAVLGLRVWMAGQPFRLAPVWAVLSGALASGRLQWSRRDGLELLLAIILADGLWGQMWNLLAGSAEAAGHTVATPQGCRCWLPYAALFSPAERAGRWLRSPRGATTGQTTAWGELLLVGAFSVAVAVSLGMEALALLGAAVLLATVSRLAAPNRTLSAISQAGFEIGLPWLLGHMLFAGPVWSPLAMACGLGYILWMSLSLLLNHRSARALLAMASCVPLVCLILARQPVALGIVAVTTLPTLAMVPWGACPQPGSEARATVLAALQPWWCAGMVVAAWGMGAAVGAG